MAAMKLISKMHPINHLLRRSFSTSAPSSSVSNKIYKEPDLRTLVETFKTYSKQDKFRQRATFYELTVRRLANAKRFDWVHEILEEQKKYKDITTEGFAIRLISLYGKSGMFDHAHQLFDEMPQLKCTRTVKSLNAILGACVSTKKFDKVEGFFKELPLKLGVKPDVVSYNTLIRAFCEMGSFDNAVLMLGEMEKEGLCPNLITFNTLFNGLYKKGRFLEGEKIWSMMEKYNVVPDNISYNMKLHGLVSDKKVREAVELVEEMKTKGLKLDVFTFNTLFKGLCDEGECSVEEAKRWYKEMLKTKCTPNRLTYAMLLTLACEKEDFLFGDQLCRGLFYCKCQLNEGVLVQKVVDGLVKQSETEKAQVLVRHAKQSKHSCYHGIQMPQLDN